MTLWIVRGGERGAETEALGGSFVTIHWNELPDLSPVYDRKELATLYRKTYPKENAAQLAARVGQVWAFRERIKVGDMVLLPLHAQSAVAVGKVAGPYRYRNDLGEEIRHTRQVDWLRTDIPRTGFQQDLLCRISPPPTVYRISGNNALQRIQVMLSGQTDPGNDPGMLDLEEGEASETEAQGETQDIQQSATDQIIGYIQSRFSRHKLADLVEAALQAEGYLTKVATPGPDGGVDILAGAAPMGFGSPRLCVQVKSSPTPVDVAVLRGLQGILKNFGAEQGLLVCWGGFNAGVIREARQSFFTIRLWDSNDLVRVLLKNYDKLSADLRAELPLKQVWALALDE